jgi:hypothetical protein
MPNNTKGIRFNLHISIGFWSGRFHGSGNKKMVRKCSEKITIIDGLKSKQNMHWWWQYKNKIQNTYSCIPWLEFANKRKGKERRKNALAPMK